MGFLKSFFGAAAANAIRDSKKEQERLNNWNALFDEASDMSLEFSDYLTNLGISDSYVSPPASELAEEGRAAVNAEKRKIENYKKKITEFINLGGHPANIWYIDRIDDYITKLKYMISIGYLDKQDDWLQTDMDMRNAKAYSQKAKVSNLKELSDMANYLKASEIYTMDDLESRVSTLRDTVDELKVTMDTETARMKEMRKMPEYVATLQELKPIVDGLQKIKFDKAKAKYKAEHEKELKRYYAARRKVLEMFPDGKYDGRILNKQYAELEQTHKETYAKFVAIREEYQRIWHIQSCVNKGLGNTEQTQQKKDNRKQEER